MRYASIRSMDISNGEGVGVALFVQGCHFHCLNCFNSSTWDFNGGKEWTEEVQQRFLELARKPYIERISILGGEPLADDNLNDIYNLVKTIRKQKIDKKIWLYSGYEWYGIFYKPGVLYTQYMDEKRFIRQDIVSNVDIMVDGKYIDSKRDIRLQWRGSSNQNVIDVQESLKNNEITIITLY